MSMKVEEVEDIDALLEEESKRAERAKDKFMLQPVSSFVVSKRHFDLAVQSSLTENRPLSDFLDVPEEYTTSNLKISDADGSIILTFLPDRERELEELDEELQELDEDVIGSEDEEMEALESSWTSQPQITNTFGITIVEKERS